MLKISANTSNNVWVNASRNKSLSSPTYLMSLEHRVSGDKKYFIPQNTTNNNGYNGTPDNDPRVDVFTISVDNNSTITPPQSINIQGFTNGLRDLTRYNGIWDKYELNLRVRSPIYICDDDAYIITYKHRDYDDLWLMGLDDDTAILSMFEAAIPFSGCGSTFSGLINVAIFGNTEYTPPLIEAFTSYKGQYFFREGTFTNIGNNQDTLTITYLDRTYPIEYENLTGGTRAFYYQKSPSLQNPTLGYTANKYNSYVFQQVISTTEGVFGVYVDSSNPSEYVFQTIFEVDGVPVDPTYVNAVSYGNGNIGGTIDINVDSQLYDGKVLYYRLQTNLGNIFEGTLYLASMSELNRYKPWEYYNLTSPIYDPGNKLSFSIPTTYLGITNIYLDNPGWYYYRIYEQTSKTNLNPSLTTDIVDEGTLYLYPKPPDEVSYTGYSTNDITIYYDEDMYIPSHILQENAFHILTENNELLTQE